MIHLPLDQIQFSPGQGYNLNVIKEIKVTESFLTLNPDVRKCDNKEIFDDCKTRHYLDSLLTNCKCLPFNIRLSDQVNYFYHYLILLDIYLLI